MGTAVTFVIDRPSGGLEPCRTRDARKNLQGRMVKTPWALVLALLLLLPSATMAPATVAENTAVEAASELYVEIGLEGHMAEAVFTKGYASIARHAVKAHMLAIADMTQPSNAKRLYLIDLDKKELVMRTWVAHGQGSGELMCTSFSNREGSHATSKGLYRVGAEIVSPKHGAALMLHGLDRGLNCQAQSREVIMHGADYVSADFIAQHGRLGRSWGCPAVPRTDMPRMIDLLADGGYLYVHGR